MTYLCRHRGGGDIAPTHSQASTSKKLMVSIMPPAPHFTRGKDPVLVQEAGWALGARLDGHRKFCLHQVSVCRPFSHNQSLCRPHYPSCHILVGCYNKIFTVMTIKFKGMYIELCADLCS